VGGGGGGRGGRGQLRKKTPRGMGEGLMRYEEREGGGGVGIARMQPI